MSEKIKKIIASKAILESMPEFAYVFNKKNELILWNKNLETILGFSKEELYKKDVFDFMKESDVEKNIEAINNIFTYKEEQSLEQNILTKSGEGIPVINTANYAYIDGEEYLIGIAIDVSKLKETERKLDIKNAEILKLKDQLLAENVYLRNNIQNQHEFKNIFGESELHLNILYQVKQVAKTNTSVLLNGEIGTKKEAFARTIHNLSKQKNWPFVKINYSEINKSEFENEPQKYLLEIEKDLKSKMKLAQNGTLLLADISEIPLEIQTILFNVFQEQKRKAKPFNVRIIATCNTNIEEMVKKNRFSKNLYFNLNFFSIDIPPLRDRRSDIPIMVENYIKRFNQKFEKNIKKVSKKTMTLLQNYYWPANNRELENVIERAVILSNTSLLKADHLIKLSTKTNNDFKTLEAYEKEYIITVLNRTFWRVSGKKGAANILGLHPETLRSKMRKLQIKKPEHI